MVKTVNDVLIGDCVWVKFWVRVAFPTEESPDIMLPMPFCIGDPF